MRSKKVARLPAFRVVRQKIHEHGLQCISPSDSVRSARSSVFTFRISHRCVSVVPASIIRAALDRIVPQLWMRSRNVLHEAVASSAIASSAAIRTASTGLHARAVACRPACGTGAPCRGASRLQRWPGVPLGATRQRTASGLGQSGYNSQYEPSLLSMRKGPQVSPDSPPLSIKVSSHQPHDGQRSTGKANIPVSILP